MKNIIYIVTLITGFSVCLTPADGQLFSLSTADYLSLSANTSCQGIALDDSGCIYVAGFTRSADFPCRDAFQDRWLGGINAFVAKFSSSGSRLIYSTFLGGSDTDKAHGIAIDPSRCAVVAGMTNSSDYPCRNAYQSSCAGELDAFITKLDSSGNALIYSSYLGGSLDDAAFDLDLDSLGMVYLSGETISSDFPTRDAYQVSRGGWEQDVFITKFTSSGSGLVYSTYLGGDGVDFGGKITLDLGDHIYIAGTTWSENFPTWNCYSPSRAGKYDAFIGKLSSSGSALLYSTYLGGGGFDFGNDVAVDKTGTAYITGFTLGEGFPELNPLYERRDEDGTAFLTRLSPSGSALLFSTCWGTPGGEEGMVVSLDPMGCIYLSGITGSVDFPLRNPFQSQKSGRMDIFIVKISPSGSDIIYSTYLGGLDYEKPFGLAINSAGSAYLAGCSYSCNFPVKSAYQPTMAGDADAFVTGVSSSGSSLIFSTYLGGK